MPEGDRHHRVETAMQSRCINCKPYSGRSNHLVVAKSAGITKEMAFLHQLITYSLEHLSAGWSREEHNQSQ